MLTKPILEVAQNFGIRLTIYIDDLLSMNKDPSKLLGDATKLVHLIISLGFVINTEKSVLEPRQSVEYLGIMFDSQDFTMSLPKRKIEKIS